MTNIEFVTSMIRDLNGMTLQGVDNWEHGVSLAKKIIHLKNTFENEKKEKEKANQEWLEEARKAREQLKKEAAERGEEIIGGETIHINADGTQEVIIP